MDQRRRSSRRGRSSGRRRPLCVPRHSCRSSARVHANGGENGQKGRSADLTHVTLSSPTLLLRIPPTCFIITNTSVFYDNGVPATTNGTRVHCLRPRFMPSRFAAVVGAGRRRAKSISMAVFRPGFHYSLRVSPGKILLSRSAPPLHLNPNPQGTARAIGRALFHKQEYQSAMIRWRAERHKNDRGSSLNRVPW